MGYRWRLRQVMASQEMFATTDLLPLLAERGVHLSREQVFRLVTGRPQRLSLDTLAALCDILDDLWLRHRRQRTSRASWHANTPHGYWRRNVLSRL